MPWFDYQLEPETRFGPWQRVRIGASTPQLAARIAGRLSHGVTLAPLPAAAPVDEAGPPAGPASRAEIEARLRCLDLAATYFHVADDHLAGLLDLAQRFSRFVLPSSQ